MRKERSLLRRVGNWPMVCKWAAEGTREREGYTRCKKGEKKKKGNANLQVGIVLASYNGPVAPILCKSSRSDQRRASFHFSLSFFSLFFSLPSSPSDRLMYSIDSIQRRRTSRLSFLCLGGKSVIGLYELFIWRSHSRTRCLSNDYSVLELRGVYFYDRTPGMAEERHD